MSNKPVVFYTSNIPVRVTVGQPAYVVPIDHPNVPSGYPARTSPVIRLMDNGVFETQNTIYKPEDTAWGWEGE